MVKLVTSCWKKCPFYQESMDGMECGHPYWKDKPAYENSIITHENSHDGKVPKECPLRAKPLFIKYKLRR